MREYCEPAAGTRYGEETGTRVAAGDWSGARAIAAPASYRKLIAVRARGGSRAELRISARQSDPVDDRVERPADDRQRNRRPGAAVHGGSDAVDGNDIRIGAGIPGDA